MIIEQQKSIVIALDVWFENLSNVVKSTCKFSEIGAYKLGFQLGLEVGLPKAVDEIKKYSDKPIIYDHQKSGTDIPDTGKSFAKVCKKSGVNAVIFFPQAGPATEKAWIESAYEENLGVIIGGMMSHKNYVRSEGGYLADEAIIEMYLNAAKLGVTDYVAPATKPEATKKIREMLEHNGISPSIYTPGLGAQGGDIKATAIASGKSWHAIVGRSICEAKDIKLAMAQTIENWKIATS